MGGLVTAADAPVSVVTGASVGLAGVGFIGLGLWARREAGRTLERERIVRGRENGRRNSAVTNALGAREMAEFIRKDTLEATGGRTYAEVAAYVDAEGKPTADAERAVKDELTGQPLENPDHDLWIQSTTLQTALTQAYLAFRLAELTIALGASFALVGIGLVAAARRRA
jgi:hypothetical protein